MVPFTTLPHEILLSIIESIDKPSATLNLICCSRFFFHLALPHLYHHISTLTPHRSASLNDEEFYNESSESLKRLYDFTCRIIESPKLALHVRAFQIDASFHYYQSLGDLLAPALDITSSLRNAATIADRPHPNQRTWGDDIWLGHNGDALLALLLPKLLRLESLDIVFPCSANRCKRMLRAVVHVQKVDLRLPSAAFGCLNEVVGYPLTTQARLGFTWEQVTLLLQVPSLRSIRGDFKIPHYAHAHAHRPTWVTASETTTSLLPEQMSNVKIINLTMQRNHPETWPVMLSACTTLESHSIEWAYQDFGRKYDFVEDQSLKDLDRATHFVAKSLESLSLVHQDNITNTETRNEGYICFFTDFPRLKDLRLGMIFVFGPDLVLGIPTAGDLDDFTAPSVYLLKKKPTIVHHLSSALRPNIETLRLVTIDSDSGRRVPLYANIEDVIRKARNEFPFLRSIIVECALTDPFPTPLATEEFLGQRAQENSWDVLLDCASVAGIELTGEWIDMTSRERVSFPVRRVAH